MAKNDWEKEAVPWELDDGSQVQMDPKSGEVYYSKLDQPKDDGIPKLAAKKAPVGMGGTAPVIPATKPAQRPVAAAPRAPSAQELSAWAEQEIARLKAGQDAPIATRRLESGSAANGYNTELTDKAEGDFRNWKDKSAPWDTGEDYDLRGAYAAGYDRDKAGHLPDTFKKPNHETFSVESKYSKDAPDLAGSWEGDSFKEPEGAPDWLTKYMRGAK